MNWFNFRGNHCELDLGVSLQEAPPIPVTSERMEFLTIPGGDGYLTFKDGAFEGSDWIARCVFNGDFLQLDKVIDNLGAGMSGPIILSSQPDRYRFATIESKLNINQFKPNESFNFTVRFKFQPFGYLMNGSTFRSLSTPTVIYNEGTLPSNPIFEVNGPPGNFSLSVEGRRVEFSNISGTLIIDSRLKSAKVGNVSMTSRMVGDFPVLQVGYNAIEFTSGYTVRIQPNWIKR